MPEVFAFNNQKVVEKLDRLARITEPTIRERVKYPEPSYNATGASKLGRPLTSDHDTDTWHEYEEYILVTGSDTKAIAKNPQNKIWVWQESGFTFKTTNTHFLYRVGTDGVDVTRKYIALPVPLKECEADLPDPGTDNALLTSDGAGGAVVEVNATFDGNNLTISNNIQSNTGFFRRSRENSITASTTQTQAGATVLTREINYVTTVANTNDAVRLSTASVGKHHVIYNQGVNTLQIFPASNDSINGLAVDLSIALQPGKVARFDAPTASAWFSAVYGSGSGGILGLGAIQSKTISSGAITVDDGGGYYQVDTEASAATDNLDTINGGQDGDIICLQATDSARTVVVRDNQGNIRAPANFSLTHTLDKILLIRDETNNVWARFSISNIAT